MSWKKHFKPVNSVLPNRGNANGSASSKVDRFSSWLPEVYMGPPDRVQRYVQYEQMDMDHEVNSALDTLAEFCTQKNDHLNSPFQFQFNNDPTPAETQILERALKQWIKLNDFNKRGFRLFRSTLQYGDQFYIRDPETYKLFWIDPHKIEKIVVNESKGKEIQTYYIHDMDLNMSSLVATAQAGKNKGGFSNTSFAMPTASLGGTGSMGGMSNYGTQSGTPGTGTAFPVAAEHIIHISLSEGLDGNWPFGQSVLEPVYKTYKQKSMLEDAMLIYRIHRAPERRIFSIDTGDLPSDKAQQVLERVRYEVQQKRIPNRSGGGQNIADASYDPMSTLEDYYFSRNSEGRGSSVDTLPGGDGLNTIDDMLYFNNHMFRALGIPSSYLPTGPSDGTASMSDGKVGTAFIQEFRFTERCKRHQRQIVTQLDREFKLFLKFKGLTVDSSCFDLEFTPPQNFSEYRAIEIDAARINVLSGFLELPFISKRFAMKKWGGFSEEEMHMNERMLKEEQGMNTVDVSDQAGMKQVGIASSDIGGDFGGADDFGDIPDLDDTDDAGTDDVDADDIADFGEE